MHDFTPLLVDIWRAACQSLELSEAAAKMVRLVHSPLPLSALAFRVLEVQHHALHTVATGGPRNSRFTHDVRTNFDPGQLRKFLRWTAAGDVARRSPGSLADGVWETIWPALCDETLIAAPLVGAHGLTGCVIFAAPSFTAEQETLCQGLLEPLAAALEIDQRLRELTTLREAAEAERRSLLARVGGKDRGDSIVGAQTGLKQVMERVELVAQSDVPVLILGETGTGKEVICRAIHVRSARRQAPFLRVNCGAIPPELLDSQLFGHEKGSFTGAGDLRRGWFERADGGTLFLDEIGELPLAAQVRLLRVLQDGDIERVGGQKPIVVDVRIIAATHRDLASMVKAGTFREDLWYRINVFPILLPRLRERQADIPSLARHFAERAASRFGLAYVDPSHADLVTLVAYDWPGNIRELGAVIDRAAILGNGKSLEVNKALGLRVSLPPAEPPSSMLPTMYEVVPVDEAPLAEAAVASVQDVKPLSAAMADHIRKALKATGGRIEGAGGAADRLGINPHTLRARMRKLGVDWAKYRVE